MLNNLNASEKRLLQKYLNQYAEAEVLELSGFPDFLYSSCIVIPAYQEKNDYLHRLISSTLYDSGGQRRDQKPQSHLAIIILNCPDTDNTVNTVNTDNIDKTRENAIYIKANSQLLWQAEHLRLYKMNLLRPTHNNLHLLLVNRIDHPIPKKQGVGLARKIGADIACYLYFNSRLCYPWIHSTDADAILPTRYLQCIEDIDLCESAQNTKVNSIEQPAYSALIYPFEHISPPEIKGRNSHQGLIDTYHLLYECRLFHYQLGLRYSGSPYAFQTIGSTLAINVFHYAMVRGFPKRSAGEDFYLLNKLLKTGNIMSLTNPTIQLLSRTSDRNPFGTGPAVQSLMDQNQLILSKVFYHPHIFILLRRFIKLFFEFSALTDSTQWPEVIAKQAIPDTDRKLIIDSAKAIGFDHALHHALNNVTRLDSNPAQLRRSKNKCSITITEHLNVWFDAFRTLKWIHFCRDYGFPNTDIRGAYCDAFYPSKAINLGLELGLELDLETFCRKNSSDDSVFEIQILAQWLSVVRQHLYAKAQTHTIRRD